MSGADPGDVVALGVVTRPQGIRGELRVHEFNRDSDLLLRVRDLVFVLPSGEQERVVVEAARRMPKALVLRLRGVRTVEEAERWRQATVGVPRSTLPAPSGDEFYLVDAVGLPVRLESGEPLGEVVEVLEYPSVTCFRVRVPEGFIEVPLLPAWVARVDPEAGEVVLRGVDDLPVEPERPRRNGA